MIEPPRADIGRRVIYQRVDKGSEGTVTMLHIESGTITSFNEKYVFVRYDFQTGTKATRREDLTWQGGP